MKALILFSDATPVGLYLEDYTANSAMESGERLVPAWSPLFNSANEQGNGVEWDLTMSTYLTLTPCNDGWIVAYDTPFSCDSWEHTYSTLTDALDAVDGIVEVDNV